MRLGNSQWDIKAMAAQRRLFTDTEENNRRVVLDCILVHNNHFLMLLLRSLPELIGYN